MAFIAIFFVAIINKKALLDSKAFDCNIKDKA
jgi:hypothetical protein